MTKMAWDQRVKLFQAVIRTSKKTWFSFSSASVYSNRGEKNTGKMLENIIIKLQTLTGGLSEVNLSIILFLMD